MLEDMGLTVETRSWLEARRYDFSASRLVIYTQNLPVGTDVHTRIIDQGLGLALFNDAGYTSGGSWYNVWGDWANWWVLTSSPGGGYLDGYRGMTIQITDERQTIYRSTTTPPGWNFGGYTYYNTGYRIAHWRENATSGGHGGILGLDPMRLNANGLEVARAMIEWCLDGSADRRIIHEGEAVLIIRSTDHLTPTLTDLESAANDLLQTSGLDVVYVPQVYLGTTDMSRAEGVFLAEGYVSPTLVSKWVSEGLHVGLMYTGSDDFGGSWTWHDHANSRRYTATGASGFNHMFTGTQFTMENTGAVYAMHTNFPSGSVRDGHAYYSSYWTGSHRIDATSGGRVAFLTFDPRDLTMAGEALYANFIAWVTNRPYPMMNATAGKVALVVNSYDETGGTLSVREEALKDNLTGMGLSIEYVSHVNSSRTDFAGSSFVVFCDVAPGRYLVDHLIEDLGKGVGMYYTSAVRHGGSWGWPSGASASTFYIIDNSTFMANYSSSSTVSVGTGSTNHPEVYNYAPAGWTYVGRMTQSGYYRTSFTRENATTGGRGLIFTYRPDQLTSAGIAVLNETFYYLLGANATIPDGNADLTVTSVAIDASSYAAGDTVTVNATIKNQGTSDVNRSFPVVFMVDGAIFGSIVVANLSNGASWNVSLNWTVLPGSHVVRVLVDPEGVVLESNEANNAKDLTVSNVAGPDLTIEAVSMQPVAREDGNFINVTVTVANVGTVNATREIEVMVMNGTRGLGSVFIQGIPKAKNATVTLIVLGLIATANMTVYADWGDRVIETDETNNTYALAGSIAPPTGQTVQAKKGTWIEIEVTADAWSHVYDAATVRLFDPEDNNVETMAYTTSSWGTRTMRYMMDDDGTWELSVAYAHTSFDYTMRIKVIDPTTGLEKTYLYQHRVGTGISGTRTYDIVVPADATWYFGPNQTVSAKEGTWINVTVTTLGYLTGNNDVYVSIVDPQGYVCGMYALWDVSGWGTRTVNAIADTNGTWMVKVWCVGGLWRYNLTIEVTDPTTGLRNSHWHHGMTGTWAQEGNIRNYHVDVPTNNDYHLRYDTVVEAEGGTWFNMTVQTRGGHTGAWLDTYLLNATGDPVTRFHRSAANQVYSPTTFTYLLDEPGNWTFSILTYDWTTWYTITLSWVDQTTGLRMTETHHGVTGSWVGRRDYTINVTAPTPKPFTYDETIYANTGDVVTVKLVSGLNYNHGYYIDLRLVNPDAFIIDQTYARISSYYAGLSMEDELYNPGTWYLAIYTTIYWCQYDLTVTITDGTTGINTTYTHRGSVSLWNSPTWRYYYINVTGVPQEQPFNPGDEATALMGTRMNLTVQGGQYANNVEFCFVRLYNPDGRVATALVRRSDGWSPHDLYYYFDMPGMWTLTFYSNQQMWKYHMALQLTDPVANSSYYLNTTLALGTVTSSTHTYYINVTEVSDWVMSYGDLELVLDVGDAVFVDVTILECTVEDVRGTPAREAEMMFVAYQGEVINEHAERWVPVWNGMTKHWKYTHERGTDFFVIIGYDHYAMSYHLELRIWKSKTNTWEYMEHYGGAGWFSWEPLVDYRINATTYVPPTPPPDVDVGDVECVSEPLRRWEANVVPGWAFEVAPGPLNGVEVPFYITPPPGTTPGQYYFTVRVRSVTNGYVTATAVAIVNVTAYGAHVAVSPALVTVDPGQEAVYSVTVNNTGLVRTTFDLRTAAVFGNFSQPNVTLDPGENVTVALTVEGNTTSFLPYGVHNMGVMAIPQPEPTIFGIAWTTVGINKAEGLAATADPTLLTLPQPNLTDGYTLTITNTGNIDQDVEFDVSTDPSIIWDFNRDSAHLGALTSKDVFLFVTPTKEGTFPLTISIICISNSSLSLTVNVTLQAGFRETNLTVTDGSAVYTDTGSLSFSIIDEKGATLLYPPHQFIFEFFDGVIWSPLLPEAYNLTSGTGATVVFTTPNVKPGDYTLRARYLGHSRYNVSTDEAVLHILKETPAPETTDARVQYTDMTRIDYRVLDDDGQVVPVNASLLRLEYKAPDGTWRDLGAAFAPDSTNEGTATFMAPDEPAGSYEMRLAYIGDDYYETGSGNGTLDVITEVTGITYTGDTSGPYGGSATLTAYLEDADNATAIAGAQVNFTINGVTYTATTNSTGYASVTISLTAPPGTYPLVVTYSGNGSFKPSTASATFVVNDVTAPSADAGADTAIDEDTIFQFDGSASSDDDPNFPGSSTFAWTFKDGGRVITLYGVRPFYVFTTPGSYLVTLNITDSGGNWGIDTVTITVRDVTRPRADAGPDQVVNEDTLVQFNASGTIDNDPAFASTATYRWTFEDGGSTISLTGLMPTYTFSTPGRYVVSLTVTDAAGNTDRDDMVVLVEDITPPVADAGPDRTVDEDTYANFDGTGSTDNSPDFPKGANFVWTYLIGEMIVRVTGRTAGHVFNDPGVYNVTLNVTDEAGNSHEDHVIFTVLDTTPPDVDAGGDLTVDEDATITLDGSGSTDNGAEFPTGATFRWTWNEGGTPMIKTGEIVQHAFETPGRYVVTLTVTDEGGNSASQVIVVIVRDLTAPVPVADDVNVDEDTPVSFDATGTTDNSPSFPLGASYLWSFEEGGRTVNLFGVTPLYIFRDPGSYNVSLTVRDQAGNSATIHITVSVNDLTAPVAEAGDDIIVDQGADAMFNGSASTDNHVDFPLGATFRWVVEDYDGTFTHMGMEASHPFGTVGAYKVTLRLTDGAGNEATDTLTVYVRDTVAPDAREIILSPVDEDVMVEVNLKPFITDNDPSFYESAVVDITIIDPWDQQHKASGLNPNLEFETPGVWNATAVVSDASGNSITVQFEIFVNDLTDPVVSVDEPGPIVDEDTEVTFDASGSTDNDPAWPEDATFSWSWEPYVGDTGDIGSHDGAVLDVTFETPGTYMVSLTVADAAGNSVEWEGLLEVLDTTATIVDIGDDRSVEEDTLVFMDVTVTDNHPLFPTGAEVFVWTVNDDMGAEWELYGKRPSFTFAEPGEYTVSCDVSDAWGNTGSDTINITVTDTTPPGGVGDLTVDDKGLGKVVLEWSPSSDSDVAGYRIYRREGSTGTWEMVAELGPTATEYTDEEVEPGKTYRYRVEAFDADGNEAPPTEQAHQAEEPETTGVFPWWMIVVAFIVGLAIALALGEARLRKQKGKEEDEDALPSDEDTLEAVDMDEELDDELEEVVDDDDTMVAEDDSDLAAITLEGLAEMDQPPSSSASDWEETK
jgi:PKD repeat protein